MKYKCLSVLFPQIIDVLSVIRNEYTVYVHCRKNRKFICKICSNRERSDPL